jgi:hypothetical protein
MIRYDDQGRKFDGDGNLNEWWDPVDLDLFNSKTALMDEQVKNYKYVDPHDQKGFNLHFYFVISCINSSRVFYEWATDNGREFSGSRWSKVCHNS